jgi:hypothetical protein
MMVEAPIAFLPSLGSLTPKLFSTVLTNERMGIEMPRIEAPRGVAFLTWYNPSHSLELKSANDSVRSGTAGDFNRLRAPGQQADQIDLTCEELIARVPPQARLDKIPLLRA